MISPSALAVFYLLYVEKSDDLYRFVSVSDSELRQAVASEQSAATALYTAQPGTPLAYVTTQPEFSSVAAATQLVAGTAVHPHHAATQHHMDPYPISAPTPHHHLQTTYCSRYAPPRLAALSPRDTPHKRTIITLRYFFDRANCSHSPYSYCTHSQ